METMKYLLIGDDELLYDIADFLWNNGNSVYLQACREYDCLVTIGGSLTEHAATTLVFTNDGVYSNAIPYPHKLFHFEQLDQAELGRFFAWCGKFNVLIH
jgi:hypothetical protein